MIDKEKVIQWMNEPSSLQESDLKDINALLKEYSAFSSAYLFKAMVEQSPETIKSAAVHCTDRAKLRSLVRQVTEAHNTTDDAQDDFQVNTENVNAFDKLGEEEEPSNEWPESNEESQGDIAEHEEERFPEDDITEVKEELEDTPETAPDFTQSPETEEEEEKKIVDEDEATESQEETDPLYKEAEPGQSWYDPAIQAYTHASEDDKSEDDKQEENKAEDAWDDSVEKNEGQTTELHPEESEDKSVAEELAESYSLPDEYTDDSHLYQYPREDKADTTPPNPDDIKNKSNDEFETEPSWASSSQPEEEVTENKQDEQPDSAAESDEDQLFRKDLQESLEELQKTRASYDEDNAEDGEKLGEKQEDTSVPQQNTEDENGWQNLSPKEAAKTDDEAQNDETKSEAQNQSEETEDEDEKQDNFADASFFGLNDLLSEEDDDNPLKKK